MTPAAEPHEESVEALLEDSEATFAATSEQTVQRDAFGEVLARTTENVMALTKIAFNVADVVVRNLRLAGRPDIDRLGRQLARTEDKLERVLQEIEALRSEAGTGAPPPAP